MNLLLQDDNIQNLNLNTLTFYFCFFPPYIVEVYIYGKKKGNVCFQFGEVFIELFLFALGLLGENWKRKIAGKIKLEKYLCMKDLYQPQKHV